MKYQEEERQFLTNIRDYLAEKIKVLWFTTGKETGRELILKDNELRNSRATPATVDGISPDNFKDKWETLKAHIPASLEIPEEVDLKKNNKTKYFFPKGSKKRLRNKGLTITTE